VGQAANETALFERRNEPVNAGLRAKVQCILHLVEAWRNAAFLDPLMDEHQQFMLLSRQHWPWPLRLLRGRRPSEQNKNTCGCSSLVLVGVSSVIVDKSGAEGKHRHEASCFLSLRAGRADDEATGIRQDRKHGAVLEFEGRRHGKLAVNVVEAGTDIVFA